MVFCRSWSTEDFWNLAFRYTRRSLGSKPGKTNIKTSETGDTHGKIIGTGREGQDDHSYFGQKPYKSLIRTPNFL